MSDESEITSEITPEGASETASPMSEGVRAFLAANPPSEQQSPVPDMEEAGGEEGNEPEVTQGRTTINPDDVYDTEVRGGMDSLFVSVKDDQVPITEEDKALYLKALLHDTPFELSVVMEHGITFKLRSLSVYETDLAMEAWRLFLKDNPDLNVALWNNYLQQFMLAMQVTYAKGRAEDYASYDYVPGKLEEHARNLIEKSQDRFMAMNAITWGLYCRAGRVFMHKAAVLQESAFNKDFWHPGATD